MKLHFSWEKSAATLSPNCRSSAVNKYGVSPLACLLTDDGGQIVSEAVSWFNEGMNRIRLVKESKFDFLDWSRDAWGAELSRDEVKIYSLYDEGCYEILNIDSFEVALLAWLGFIQMEPEGRVVQEIEV